MEDREKVQGQGAGRTWRRCRTQQLDAGAGLEQGAGAGCRYRQGRACSLTALLSSCLQGPPELPCRAPSVVKAQEPPLCPDPACIPWAPAAGAPPRPCPNKGPCQRPGCPCHHGDITAPGETSPDGGVRSCWWSCDSHRWVGWGTQSNRDVWCDVIPARMMSLASTQCVTLCDIRQACVTSLVDM